MDQLDALSAKEGTVFFSVDGKQFELAELISLEAEVELTTAKVNPLGYRMEGQKVVGAKGSGTVKMYYHRPEMKQIALNYIKRGILPRIDIKATNDDPTSRAGRYTALLKGVLFTKMQLMKLDGSSDDVIEEELDFTFQDYDILSAFKPIN